MSSRFTVPVCIVYAHEKALNYSISSAEDDKLLPKGRPKHVLMDPRVRNSRAIRYTSPWG